MIHAAFEKIAQEIAAMAGAETDWHHLAKTGLLHIDGVPMKIQPDITAQQERLVLHVDFGSLPDEGEEDLMRMLLGVNFLASVSNLRFFSTNPKNGQIIATSRLPLNDETDGARMIERLREEVRAVREWQELWSSPDMTEATAPEYFFDKI
jgi:hypothetical protein